MKSPKVKDLQTINVLSFGDGVPYEEVLKGLQIALQQFGAEFGNRRVEFITEVDKTESGNHAVRFRFFLRKSHDDDPESEIIVSVTQNPDGTYNYQLM